MSMKHMLSAQPSNAEKEGTLLLCGLASALPVMPSSVEMMLRLMAVLLTRVNFRRSACLYPKAWSLCSPLSTLTRDL
jgi:hypothetical protein